MECFTVYANEIKGRLDPLYLKNIDLIKNPNTKFKLVAIGNLLKDKVQYGANEIAVEGDFKKAVRYIRITDIDKFGNLKDDDWKTAQKIDKKYLLEENDILFARSGATAGKTFIYKKEFGKSIFAGYLIRFKIDKKKVNPKFIFFYTQLNRYNSWVKSIQRPSGQPNINSEEFKSFKIPLPPTKIQNKIISLMESAYYQKKQKEAEAKQLLDSIGNYVLDELGIRLSKIEDKMTFIIYADDVKEGRTDAYYYKPRFKKIKKALEKGKYKLRSLKEFITKIHYGASVKNIYVDKGIPLLRILNLKPSKLDLQKVVNLPFTIKKEIGNAFVSEGNLLISRSGTVGIVTVVPKEADGYAFGSFMIKFCLNETINKEYVSIWLNTKLMNQLIEREKIGAIQGNITIGTIESFEIPLPPLEVQNKIAEEVRSRIQKSEQLQKEAKEIINKAKEEVEKTILEG